MKLIAPILAITVSIVGLAVAPASADVIIDAPTFSVTAPSTGTANGYFEVTLDPNDVSPTTELAGFDVLLTITTGQSTFLLARPYVQTPSNYVFASSGGVPITVGTPGAYSIIGEGDVAIGNEQALSETFGLIRVPYTVGPVASPEMFTISMTAGATDATDAAGDDLNPVLQDGTVTVNPATPEPGSIFTIGTVGSIGLVLRRRRQSAVFSSR
jgi:hypothetical protein